MNSQSSTIVQRVWNYCNVLRDERRLSVVGEVESAVEAGLVRAANKVKDEFRYASIPWRYP
jgi:hypothetical protein